MNLRYLSAWSIKHPVVPLVLFVALTLAGLIAFNRMEVQNEPDIDFPAVVVSISQPGAAPTELDTQITQKVESAVSNVEGIETIQSRVSEGNSQTILFFEIGNDVNDLVNEVDAAVQQIRGDLPDGIIEPQVRKINTLDNFASYAVVAEDMTMEELSWFVDDTVSKRLLAVPGMARAGRSGGVDREIRVILDPARMQSLGVTASQVNSAIAQSNLDAGGGQAEIAGARQSVRVLGTSETAFELGQRRISLGGGRSVKLSDIAEVTDGESEVYRISKVDGRPVVTFDLTRARGESDVTVYDEAQVVMDEIEAENPGLEFVELFNVVKYTKAQYKSSMAALIEGAILAVIVVFFFLRDWRATIISAIAIPLSAVPTFFFLEFMGFTLNQMSLLALGLVAGVLVDDAIVEIENIVRHMRMGKSAYQASIDAADEIGLAVVATSFSIVAVFLPVAMMPGIAGQYFQNFGVTVVVSVLMSLAVARMITPMLAAYFLKEHGVADHANGPWIDRYSRILAWTLDRDKARAIKARKIERKGKIGFFGKLGAHLRGDHRAGDGHGAAFLRRDDLPLRHDPGAVLPQHRHGFCAGPHRDGPGHNARTDRGSRRSGQRAAQGRARGEPGAGQRERSQRVDLRHLQGGSGALEHRIRTRGIAEVQPDRRCARQLPEHAGRRRWRRLGPSDQRHALGQRPGPARRNRASPRRTDGWA